MGYMEYKLYSAPLIVVNKQCFSAKQIKIPWWQNTLYTMIDFVRMYAFCLTIFSAYWISLFLILFIFGAVK